jgi:hypothetical protein
MGRGCYGNGHECFRNVPTKANYLKGGTRKSWTFRIFTSPEAAFMNVSDVDTIQKNEVDANVT